MNFLTNSFLRKNLTYALVAFFLLSLCSCAMLFKPTSSFDRRMKAKSYGEIISQSSPDCENCSDRFLIKKDDGCVITLVIKYDGRVEVYE